jgi:hypothetical protein
VIIGTDVVRKKPHEEGTRSRTGSDEDTLDCAVSGAVGWEVLSRSTSERYSGISTLSPRS